MSKREQEQWNLVADRFWTALDQGDIEAVMDCCLPTATCWHNFDQKLLDFAATEAAYRAFVSGSVERTTTNIRRDFFVDGFVQQHILEVRFQPGAAKRAWPICVLMRFKEGKIAVLREYIDRAGSYDPEPEFSN